MVTLFRRLERHCSNVCAKLNDIAIEDNYANISLEEIEDTYINYGKQRKPYKKKVK